MSQRSAHRSRLFVLAVGAAILVSFACLHGIFAQSETGEWEKAAGGKMSFDVASVKRNVSSVQGSDYNVPFFGDRFPENGGLYSAKNNGLSSYIAFAYKLDRTQWRLLDAQIPKWAAVQRFDIEARAPAGTTKDQMRLMMQSVLADRFALEAHFATPDIAVYALELVKPGTTGPKLRAHTE